MIMMMMMMWFWFGIREEEEAAAGSERGFRERESMSEMTVFFLLCPDDWYGCIVDVVFF